eukprot:4248897-Pleurochrysis_carterae.AAC.1
MVDIELLHQCSGRTMRIGHALRTCLPLKTIMSVTGRLQSFSGPLAWGGNATRCPFRSAIAVQTWLSQQQSVQHCS